MLETTNQYNTHLYQNIIEYKLWKIKFMFETTNRICVPIPMIGLMGKLSKLWVMALGHVNEGMNIQLYLEISRCELQVSGVSLISKAFLESDGILEMGGRKTWRKSQQICLFNIRNYEFQVINPMIYYLIEGGISIDYLISSGQSTHTHVSSYVLRRCSCPKSICITSDTLRIARKLTSPCLASKASN